MKNRDRANSYDYILGKISALKKQYSTLRDKADHYVFSALCIKANFYKNPALTLDESDFAEMIVDSTNDGGVDILLSDPDSETADLVIGQSKLYKEITGEEILNAVCKMADFYNDMKDGHYEQVNERVQSRFLKCNAEIGDNSKIQFVFYTSAPQPKNFDMNGLERKFRKQFTSSSKFTLEVLFAADVADEIRASESMNLAVAYGKIRIDDKNNYLMYGDDAVIVNVSAFSIKKLYAEHNVNLLSQNLRYYIKGGKLNSEINKTINKTPELFWLKNNGITITCDKFELDGCEVKLWNFSIVNGGQTTHLLCNNKSIDASNDVWLSCKIIKTVGDSVADKIQFNVEIAQAANAQKPIKPADLLANASEQIYFAKAMLAVGVFYQTKRGAVIQKNFRKAYLHTKLEEVGKLCLAAIFQEPCKSRNNPSASYRDSEYYEPIFNGNRAQVVKICKELLYIDYYFNTFLDKFERDNKNTPTANQNSFARLARRICIAFTALAARYHQGNLTDKDLEILTSAQSDSNSKTLCKTLRDLGTMKNLLPLELYTDSYNAALDKLFTAIIEEGATVFSLAKENNPELTETNFMKSDKNYYSILKLRWKSLRRAINETFADV